MKCADFWQMLRFCTADRQAIGMSRPKGGWGVFF
jgi:hypothetical protein